MKILFYTAASRSILLFAFIVLMAGAAHSQCTPANPAGCSCPPPGGANCFLLPDITAGKSTLNAVTGWEEHPQSAAAPNKGLLRLDVSTPNVGWGPLEVFSTNDYVCGGDTLHDFIPPSGFLCPDGSYPKRLIKQRIYEKVGNTFNLSEHNAGWMVYHPAHGHIHIEGWGLYTLRLRDNTITDTLQWPIVNSGVKVSFCLIDLSTCSNELGDCVDAAGNVLNNASFPNYGFGKPTSCGNVIQGIGVGKVDIYDRYLDESFVKIPYEACNGDYHVVVQIDPDNHFLEINENNNWLAARTTLTKQRTANTNPYAYIFSKAGNTVCAGSSIQLEASGASKYIWSTGATTQKISVNTAGRYWVTATTPCGTATSDTLDVFQSGTSGFPTETRTDTICAGERANVYASGNAHWYDAPVGGNLIYIGNNFNTGNLLANTTFYVTDQLTVKTGGLAPATTTFSGAGNYTAARREYLIFNAFLPFKLKTVTVNASGAGIRVIQVRDQYGRLIQEKSVSLAGGTEEILLDFFIPAGLNHQLGLSSASPAASLYTSTTTDPTIGYPFTFKSVANIVGSSFGDKSFPFFYNWKVEVTPKACNNGERKPITIITVPAPVIDFAGLLPTYMHTALPVRLTGTPSGGTFSGTGVIGEYFYPRIAGPGSHIVTYTQSNSECTSQKAKETLIVLDESRLNNGFSVQLMNQPGNRPVLWVISREASDLDISLYTSTGQLLQTIKKNVWPGSSFVQLNTEKYPKGVYMIKVVQAATGATASLKLVN